MTRFPTYCRHYQMDQHTLAISCAIGLLTDRRPVPCLPKADENGSLPCSGREGRPPAEVEAEQRAMLQGVSKLGIFMQGAPPDKPENRGKIFLVACLCGGTMRGSRAHPNGHVRGECNSCGWVCLQ